MGILIYMMSAMQLQMMSQNVLVNQSRMDAATDEMAVSAALTASRVKVRTGKNHVMELRLKDDDAAYAAKDALALMDHAPLMKAKMVSSEEEMQLKTLCYKVDCENGKSPEVTVTLMKGPYRSKCSYRWENSGLVKNRKVVYHLHAVPV